MPRLARIDVPDTVYHIYTRGNHKAPLFLDDKDRRYFLKFLERAQEKYPWDLLNYKLMTNHYHLQVKTLSSPLWKTMHTLNTLYAGYFNNRHGQVGHLFQGRFHSIPVEADSYLLVLSRYVQLNAVVAGIVQRPEDYEWSSYRAYTEGKDPTGLVRTDLILDTLSLNNQTQREQYRKFVEDEIGRPPRFTDELLWKTRTFGSDAFVRGLFAKCPGAFPHRMARIGTVPMAQ